MRLVADAGPVHYLVLIEQTAVLGAMFEGVCVPETVRAELDHSETPDAFRKWIASPPAWLSIAPVQPQSAELAEGLGPGERAVIAVAARLQPGLILMDDRAGVAAARRLGFAVTGTLGLLFQAARLGLIDLPTSLVALKRTNFHYTQALLDRVLARFEDGASDP